MPIAPYAFSRRQLFKSTAAIAAAWGLPFWYTEELLGQSAAQTPKSPNDQPPIALIGCGGRGRAIIGEAKRFGRVVAVCDVDDAQRRGAAADLGNEQSTEIRQYKDFRELLDKEKDLAAVCNGTPDHWHTLVNMRVLKSGRDVYSEKPLTLTIDEGKRLVKLVKETGRVLQTGTQQRSDRNFRLAAELVRNGRLGKLDKVTTILPAGLREGPFKEQQPPATLDWDMYLGQAPKVPYMKERTFLTFRFWYDYSGGTITDWGAHHNDIARWALGELGPASIEAKRLAEPIPGGYTTVPEYQIEYKWPSGVTHICRTTTADTIFGGERRKTEPGERRIGILFEGPKGWIYVTRGKIEASEKALIDEPLAGNAERLYRSDNHMANFFECLRTRKLPAADVETGHRSVSVCHLGAISTRLNRKLQWDPEKEAFVGDDEAQSYVAREQRKPWTYDAVL